MGYCRAETFDKSYIRQIVGTDTQSAFLDKPSQNALMRVAGQMRLTQDPRVKTAIRSCPASDIERDARMQTLSKELAGLQLELRSKNSKIISVHGTPLGKEYQRVQNKIRSTKKRIERAWRAQSRRDHFATFGCREIDRQRRGEPIEYQERATF